MFSGQHAMRRRVTFWRGSPALAPCCLRSTGVWAGDMAAAQALFIEGRQPVEQATIEQACETSTASQCLDPSAGTLPNLARCHERQGTSAGAWADVPGGQALRCRQGP